MGNHSSNEYTENLDMNIHRSCKEKEKELSGIITELQSQITNATELLKLMAKSQQQLQDMELMELRAKLLKYERESDLAILESRVKMLEMERDDFQQKYKKAQIQATHAHGIITELNIRIVKLGT